MMVSVDAHSDHGILDAPHVGVHPAVHQPAPAAIREQLEKLLASEHFAHSPRCGILLRYVVEEWLEGNAGALKERYIGIQVFKRDAAYDTNADPVVRMAIRDIRKKLAEYYIEQEHRSQLRLELPKGSYVPVFSLPQDSPLDDAEPSQQADTPLEPNAAETVATLLPLPRRRFWRLKKKQWIAAVASTLLVVCTVVAVSCREWIKDPFEAFWAPFVKSPNPVLFSMWQASATPAASDASSSNNTPGLPVPVDANGVIRRGPIANLDDSMTAMMIAGLLRSEKQTVGLRSKGAITYEDMQEGPVVFVGRQNGDWMARLMQSMRFRFNLDTSAHELWISDQNQPGAKLGLLRKSTGMAAEQDLAIVVRVVNSETRQPFLLVAGLTAHGTHAAGEFVTNPKYLNDYLKTAPRNWRSKNLELLLRIDMSDSEPAPPHVVAISVW